MSDLSAVRAKIAELRAMESAATPSPWGVNKYGGIGTGTHFVHQIVITALGFDADASDNTPELVCALRNAAPSLLDLVSALLNERDDLWGPGENHGTVPLIHPEVDAAIEEFARMR